MNSQDRDAGAGHGEVALVRLLGPSAELPPMEHALSIGELVRRAVIAATDRASPEQRSSMTLARLSGHDLAREAAHTAYLPGDADGDGRIDHALMHLASGFDAAAWKGFSRLERIWDGRAGDWAVRISEVDRQLIARHPYLAVSTDWVSVTPYFHPWYRKKGFGVEEQIARECRERGWPVPAMERVSGVRVGDRLVPPTEFRSVRDKPDVRQPDRIGSCWRLRFPEPVRGPVTLGFGRFWGLGTFRDFVTCSDY